MPQQTSTFESHFLTHMQGVAGAYHKLIACSWVPILQVGGLGKVRVNCFPKAITTWLGWESNPRPPDPESDALTTLPRCPCYPLCPILQVQPPPVWWTVNPCAQFSKCSLHQFGELLTPVPNSPSAASTSLVNCYPLCQILQVQPPPVWWTVTPCAQFSKSSLHQFCELLTPVPNSPSAASTSLVNC